MSIQAIKANNNISFQGSTKKTPRGNEYPITHSGRNKGLGVGLLSGALTAHIATKSLKSVSSKKMILQSLDNIGKDMSSFGGKGKRAGFVKKGIMIVNAGLVALGMFIGATIGGTVDSHNNKNSAIAADKAVKGEK